MHLWMNNSINKASKLWNVSKKLGSRPKNMTDEEWKAFVSEEKLNKKIMLDCVPKASQKVVSSKRD